MSSPKRAAKIVAKAIVDKTAAKTAAKAAAARSLAKSHAKLAAKAPVRALRAVPKPAAPANGVSADAKRVAAALERSVVDGKLDTISTDALQALIAAACRVYTARAEAGEHFTPIPKNSITATDVMVTASGLLKAADLAVFELGMWQSWTGR